MAPSTYHSGLGSLFWGCAGLHFTIKCVCFRWLVEGGTRWLYSATPCSSQTRHFCNCYKFIPAVLLRFWCLIQLYGHIVGKNIDLGANCTFFGHHLVDFGPLGFHFGRHLAGFGVVAIFSVPRLACLSALRSTVGVLGFQGSEIGCGVRRRSGVEFGRLAFVSKLQR